MTGQVFEFSYARALSPLFVALGMGPRFSRVTVGADAVVVRMGWAFSARIPRTSVADAAPDNGRVAGWGVHGWGGRWLVNGSSEGLVRLRLDPPVRGWLLSVLPLRVRELWLSLTDANSFLAALQR